MNGKNMNIKREQAKNKIQFILDAMTLKGKRYILIINRGEK